MKFIHKNSKITYLTLGMLIMTSLIGTIFIQSDFLVNSQNTNNQDQINLNGDPSGNTSPNGNYKVNSPIISVSLSASKNPAYIGDSVTFTASGSGGSGSYYYTWTSTPTGCSDSGASTLTCSITTAEQKSVSVTVADQSPTSTYLPGSKSITFNAYTVPTLGKPTFNSSTGSIDLSQWVTFTASPSGGSGTFSYSWTSLPSGCNNIDSNTITCQPSSASSNTISVTATDSGGYAVSNSVSFDVLTATTVAKPAYNTTNNYIYLGASVKFTSATPSNGLSPYSYHWNGLPTGCSDSASNIVSCTPTGIGSFSVSVTVTDNNNYQVTSSSLAYTVYDVLSLATPSSNSSTGSIDLGQGVTFTSATPSGGRTPYSYAWLGLPAGCTDSGSSSITCTPTSTGIYFVNVTITDTNGAQITSSNLHFDILADPVVTTPTANTTSGGIDPGQAVSFSTTASGGANSFSYVWLNLPTGCATQNSNTISCSPTAGGTFNVQVEVTDSNNFVVTSSVLSYIIRPSLIVNNITATVLSLTVSQSTTLSVVASGGTGFSTFSYQWNNLPQGCSSSNASSILCSPIASGKYSVTVTVTDANSYSVTSNATTIDVSGGLSVNTIQTSQSSVDYGQSVTFTASPSGGNSPYSYLWFGLPAGCADSGAISVTCTPTVTGTFYAYVNVTDSNNVVVKSPILSFTIYSILTVQTLSASPVSVDLGQNTTFSALTIGGSGSNTYLWISLPSGCSSSDSNTLFCSPSSTGSFNIKVNVTDSNGFTATSESLTFNVFNAPSITTPTPSTSSGTTGTNVTFSADGSGGSGSLTYSWTTSSSSLVCYTSSTNSITCMPIDPGNYTITVTVTDSNGGTATKMSGVFTVTGSSINTSSSSSTTTTTSSNNNGKSDHTTSNTNGKSSPGFSGSMLILAFTGLASSVIIHKKRKLKK